MKRVGFVFILLFLLIITSCGEIQTENMLGFDGVVYNYKENYVINGSDYEIYLPDNIKENIFYSFNKSDINSSSENWIINFNHEVVYYSNLEFEFSEEFYNYIMTLTDFLDDNNLSFDIYKDKEIIECEFNIENLEKDNLTYGVLVSHFPIKLINSRYTNYILVPFMIDVLKIKDNQIETIEKDTYIPYEQFLENSKLI